MHQYDSYRFFLLQRTPLRYLRYLKYPLQYFEFPLFDLTMGFQYQQRNHYISDWVDLFLLPSIVRHKWLQEWHPAR